MDNSNFTVELAEAGERLDLFLAGKLKDAGLSREKIKRAIKQGQVLVNETVVAQAKLVLAAGDAVRIEISAPPASIEPEEGELEVLYQDEFLAVLNKPAGLVVHPGSGRETGTLAHRLVAHFPSLRGQEGFRPGIVHRIDKDTSGLLLAALTEQSRLALSGMFAGHHIYKEYLALLSGVPDKARGEIKEPIGRHPQHKTKMAVLKNGRPARSEWRVLHADPEKRFSLVAVRIHTGRTHQIRVHMTHTGHPLLGDSVYGRKASVDADPAPRQMLHAWRLAFPHPFKENKKLSFTCPLPADFVETARALGLRMLRAVVTGSPGCGKSALLEAFKEIGFPVFSSDAEVRKLYEPGGEGHRQLRSRYGERFVPEEKGPVDKPALGAAMRESEVFRREVERMIHPLVQGAMLDFYAQSEKQGAAVAVVEVPLYFEAGFGPEPSPKSPEPSLKAPAPSPKFPEPSPANQEDRNKALAVALNAEPLRPLTIGVHCPFAARRERMIENRGWDDATISMMESWQWPEAAKMAACDLVIDNSASREALTAAAKELAGRLLEIRELRGVLLAEKILGKAALTGYDD